MTEIPAEVRELLAEVYQPEGWWRWWTSPNRMLDYRAPFDVYDDDPEHVLDVLHGMAEGTAT